MTIHDISNILQEWQYEPGKLTARVINAEDGRELLQLRIELGIVQMELHDRPDGIQQEGYSSLLDLYQNNEIEGGLDAEMCRRIREEGVQQSHRAAALFSIDRWKDVIRDCNRNLELFDLCKRHAIEEYDQNALEQFRASVITLRTRSAAEWAMSEENTVNAMAAIDQGLDELMQLFGEDCDQLNEVQLLRGMKEALVPRLPTSERADLKERLAAAIENENYELAAIIRDEIRLLRE